MRYFIHKGNIFTTPDAQPIIYKVEELTVGGYCYYYNNESRTWGICNSDINEETISILETDYEEYSEDEFFLEMV